MPCDFLIRILRILESNFYIFLPDRSILFKTLVGRKIDSGPKCPYNDTFNSCAYLISTEVLSRTKFQYKLALIWFFFNRFRAGITHVFKKKSARRWPRQIGARRTLVRY